jgi:catechol 2,3-dioxygenase-like lactoylglutathione lyase family enzyme
MSATGETSAAAVAQGAIGCIAMSHLSMHVDDLDGALAFYEDGLGFRRVSRRTFNGTEVVALVLGRSMIELVRLPETAERSPDAHRQYLSFSVEDMDAAIDELGRRGITITRGPFAMGEMRVAFATGPDGRLFELMQLAGGATTGLEVLESLEANPDATT